MAGPFVPAPPPKASSSDLDTGTNDVKYATAKAIADAANIPFGAPGSQYNLLASNGSAWTVQAFATILAALRPLDIQFYDASDTWTKPTGATFVVAMLIGGGGGGGSGRRSSSGTLFGGEGGSPGGTVLDIMLANALDSTESVTVGAGGAGGASKTAVGDGNAGSVGGETTFAHLAAGGGRQGRGGTSTGPTSTPVSPPQVNGGTSLLAPKSTIYSGSGGTISAPEGGHCGAGDHGSGSTTGGVSGGTGAAGAGGFNNDPGDDGVSAPSNTMAGGSGGGGGFSAGSAGGAGGTPGGGGGGGAHGDAGGGAGDDSGAGGAGGDGRAVIITFGY